MHPMRSAEHLRTLEDFLAGVRQEGSRTAQGPFEAQSFPVKDSGEFENSTIVDFKFGKREIRKFQIRAESNLNFPNFRILAIDNRGIFKIPEPASKTPRKPIPEGLSISFR